MKPKVYAYPTQDNLRKYAKLDLLLNPIGDEYFTWVTDPSEADFLYSPCDLGLVWWDSHASHGDPRGGQYIRDFVAQFSHWQGNQERHFFHDYSACSDDWKLPAILFRAVKSKYDPNTRTVSVPHTVEDFMPTPISFAVLPYDICFVGRWCACEARRVACEAVKNDPAIKSRMVFRETFYGYVERDNPDEANRQKAEFVATMALSRMVLSVKGVELDAYRTWEAMSAGRIPVWIGDDYELPFLDLVDYGTFMFQIPECEAYIANVRIKEFMASHSSIQLQVMGQIARQIWLKYFSREQVPETYTHYLRKFL